MDRVSGSSEQTAILSDEQPHYMAIGLMSGTSLDGIDVACIETDGQDHVVAKGGYFMPYEPAFRARVKALEKGCSVREYALVEQELTLLHKQAVLAFIEQSSVHLSDIDLVGFHGQTLYHEPDVQLTVQMGNGALLAAELGVPVVCDFRRYDVALGGQGAPLVPIYHRALATSLQVPMPLVVLNIGGVSNISYLGEGAEDIIAFDTGPGNALLDDFVHQRTGKHYDEQGKLAAQGKYNPLLLERALKDPYFDLPFPKSLDRNHFHALLDNTLTMYTEDGAATWVEFTVRAIAKAFWDLPIYPAYCLVAGGGRLNHFLMERLSKQVKCPVESIDSKGLEGDMIESQAFAYLAVRSQLGLPISFPTTTGIMQPATGGALYRV